MAQEQNGELHLVVIGASAGGVNALERLTSLLDADFRAPIVIAQHQDPGHDDRLAAILASQTNMKVQAVSDRAELQPGTIFIVPAGRNVTIEGEQVTATKKGRGRPVPSIDTLFTSASQAFGERVIAVILSGMGSDGASGVRDVKERGGTVVVQEPESAAYPGLPGSIPLNHVDFVGNVETIASVLTSIVSATDAATDVNNPDVLRAFLAQLRVRSHIDFRQYKTPTIVRRLSRLMAASGCKTLGDYLRYLNANPEAYQRLVSSFLIKVTGFFRDPALFRQLREQLLPEVVAQARKHGSELRIWSAGCATGEEAYSVAILLAEILGEELDDLPIRIFATDLDSDAIVFARRGLYPSSAFTSMPEELITKYFTRVDDAYQIKKRIRNLTVFGEYDLGQRAPFPRIDMILCRNVLIYFTKELQQRTLQLFAFSLRVGGFLVLGKAETTNPLPQFFTPVHPMLKIFRRQGERLLIPAPTFVEAPTTLPERPSARRNALRAPAVPRRMTGESSPRWSLTERLGSFLFDSPIGVVVVDRNYDILTINQGARKLLGIHGQGIGDDLVHLAADIPSLDLKNALDSAFRSEMPTHEQETEVVDSATNESRFLQLSCYPDRTASKDGRIEAVVVVVVDTTKNTKRRRIVETENEDRRRALERLSVQNDELLERQRSLIEANNELTAANNDLRNANEHLLIAAEEAEASAEEVETLNEEMQATSEELETLNEELQATVEELNTTNEELAARGTEMERVANERQAKLDEANTIVGLLRSALQRQPHPVALIDGAALVIAASQPYLDLATQNTGRLPSIGEAWHSVPERIDIKSDGRALTVNVRANEISANGARAVLVELTE